MKAAKVEYEHGIMFWISFPKIIFHPENDENKVFHGLTSIMIVKEPDTKISVLTQLGSNTDINRQQLIAELIERYKDHIRETQLKDGIYK